MEDYLQSIQEIELNDNFNAEAFGVLAFNTKSLTKLMLTSCEWLEDETLKQILQNNSNLKTVSLTNSNNVNAAALQPMLGK